MTAQEYRDKLRAAGFRLSCIWQARETGAKAKYPTVEGWAVYGPDGHILTSIVIREVKFLSDRPGAIFVFGIMESGKVEDDIAWLSRLNDRALEHERKAEGSLT